ncbi:hypothetical protein CEP68_02350 [Brevundimonas vesicularis]|uniref:Uncharacterized protein n=2 Tax=Brevundimonas vesicularis TaxID=41276 RepID=A0A1Z3U580_BREVE|nr:hypothetical protein CEP68_02350 [Brevundimonas vesicularis]
MAFSRHATGANPRIVIALVNEIERLRAALSTTPVAETAGEAVDEGAAGEGLYLTKGVLARLRALSCHSSLGPLGMDELRQALAARAHPSPTPAADADRVREIVVKAVKAAMKDAWEDHATDTGCWPADIKRVSARGPLRLTFTPAIWAQTTAEWAAETVLASLQPEEK